jgi:tetratricopeptide (TPR) repeat protein
VTDNPQEPQGPPRNCLLSLMVLALTTCICLTTITLSGFGGYQDEYSDIQTEDVETSVAEVATQYSLALEDEAAGLWEFAYDRYEFIETEQPGYNDVAERRQEVAIMLSHTPTSAATDTPEATVTPTATIEATASEAASEEAAPAATSGQFNVAEFFDDAEDVYNAGLYEEAIAFLDIVISLDPEYRRSEVDSMLFNSLKQQAMIYFRGANTDDGSHGETGDQLSRGVLLAERALGMREENPQVGEEDRLGYWQYFVNNYVTARAYIAGGRNAAAIPLLERLCSENCEWGFRGVTVRDLLDGTN